MTWTVPSLADVLFLALVAWLVAFTLAGGGAMGLVQDTDTGTHIRTGEWILEHHAVPMRDPFSFTRPGEPWFAWEWLATLIFALLYRSGGFAAVIVFSAAVIATSIIILLRHSVERGANALVAIFAVHLAIGASSLHYLARPHIFTLLFLAASLRLLERRRHLWLLVPITALWANLHGAFIALPASLAVMAAGSALERNWTAVRREAGLAAACLAASLLNPYGVGMHLHIVDFLRQQWVAGAVQEYHSPRFHLPEYRYFEVLLFAAVLTAGSLAARRQFARALLIVAWAHLALVSQRHIPLFAIVSLPLLAAELNALWDRHVKGVLAQLARDHAPGLTRNSVWPLAVTLALLFVPLPWPKDFPADRYPVEIATRQASMLRGARVFTLDSWGAYLNFRFYPQQRVFFDGRSDFFGQQLFDDYQTLLYGGPQWQALLAKYRVEAALVPSSSSLASLLRLQSNWRLVDENSQAALFVALARAPGT